MILFILGTDLGKIKSRHYSNIYLVITIFVLIFGYVYEQFGHGVYSNFMIYAFMIPLFMGNVFWLIMSKINKQLVINAPFVNMWGATIATFTVGCLYKGILDIYGTAGNLTKIYWIVGSIMLIGSLIAFAAGGNPDKE